MSRMLAVPAVLVVAFVANAWWLVFGTAATPAASPLAGEVLFTALLGSAVLLDRFSPIRTLLLS